MGHQPRPLTRIRELHEDQADELRVLFLNIADDGQVDEKERRVYLTQFDGATDAVCDAMAEQDSREECADAIRRVGLTPYVERRLAALRGVAGWSAVRGGRNGEDGPQAA